jgi:DtxR family transcriptional regulator, Mn-dependent transcriptional regulator
LFDPHGDPIPDAKGKIQKSSFIKLSEAKPDEDFTIMGVTNHSTPFLKYLEKQRLIIGAKIKVKFIEEFDESIHLMCEKKEMNISQKVAESIIVESKI